MSSLVHNWGNQTEEVPSAPLQEKAHMFKIY